MLEQRAAPIIALDELAARRSTLGTLVCTSGGYDPIHPGHATCILESKRFGDTLAVIVNGDSFLTAKKGRPFQDLRTRCLIVSCMRCVDYVVPFEIEGDPTVNVALQILVPNVFTKGGDRVDASSIAEWDTCQRLGIRVETGVGMSKEWSSSDFLKDWVEFSTRKSRRD